MVKINIGVRVSEKRNTIPVKQKWTSCPTAKLQLKDVFNGYSCGPLCRLIIKFLPHKQWSLDPLNTRCIQSRWRCTVYQEPCFLNLALTTFFPWPFHWASCWKDTKFASSGFCLQSKWWKKRIEEATSACSMTELLENLCPSLRDVFKI